MERTINYWLKWIACENDWTRGAWAMAIPHIADVFMRFFRPFLVNTIYSNIINGRTGGKGWIVPHVTKQCPIMKHFMYSKYIVKFLNDSCDAIQFFLRKRTTINRFIPFKAKFSLHNHVQYWIGYFWNHTNQETPLENAYGRIFP